MGDFISIVDAINKYGWPPVLLAALIFVVFWIVKHEANRDDKATEERAKEAEQRQALIDMVTSMQQKTQQYPVHTEAQEKETCRFYSLVSKQMQELRDNTRANRAAFIAYHNGGAMLNARPFSRASVTAEKTDVKTPTIIQDYQNLQGGLIATAKEKIATDGYYFCGDVSTINDHAYKDILKSWNAKSVYCAAVMDNINDVVVGFIFLQFDHTMEENADIKNEILTVAGAVSGAVQMKATD